MGKYDDRNYDAMCKGCSLVRPYLINEFSAIERSNERQRSVVNFITKDEIDGRARSFPRCVLFRSPDG